MNKHEDIKIKYVHFNTGEFFALEKRPYFDGDFRRNRNLLKAMKNAENGAVDINQMRRGTAAYTIIDGYVYIARSLQHKNETKPFVKAQGRKLARERLYKNIFDTTGNQEVFTFDEIRNSTVLDKKIKNAILFDINKLME